MTAQIKIIKIKGVYSLHNLYLKLCNHYIPFNIILSTVFHKFIILEFLIPRIRETYPHIFSMKTTNKVRNKTPLPGDCRGRFAP